MLLLTHHNEDRVTPIAIMPDNSTQERIDEVIVESFKDWCCPPEGKYELFRDPKYPTTVYIKYSDGTGYIDYDGDGYFTTEEVPVK